MGVTIQSSLKASLHCFKIVSKTSVRANLILNAFLSRDPHILARGFTAYVRLILEYCSTVYSPHYKCDIVQLERVQRTFTRRLFRKCHLQYATCDERLALLGLQKLQLRCLYADLVYMYKLLHGRISSSLTTALSYAKCGKTKVTNISYLLVVVRSLFLAPFFLSTL